jgi:hypothetical protein
VTFAITCRYIQILVDIGQVRELEIFPTLELSGKSHAEKFQAIHKDKSKILPNAP